MAILKKTTTKVIRKGADLSSDFSVIKTGGKQYIVRSGDLVRIEKLSDKEYKEGDAVTFDEVLLTQVGGKVTVGTPFLSGAKVSATVKEITRDNTIHVVKYMPKSRYYKKNGHRQPKFVVEIN